MEFTLNHSDTGPSNIVLLFDGVPYEADSTHPWWDEIVDFALDDDPRVLDLFPIRPVQQPSTLIERPLVPDEAQAVDALEAFYVTRPWLDPLLALPSDYDAEELGILRSIFDRAGFGTCDNPDCTFCYGPRA